MRRGSGVFNLERFSYFTVVFSRSVGTGEAVCSHRPVSKKCSLGVDESASGVEDVGQACLGENAKFVWGLSMQNGKHAGRGVTFQF